MTWTAAGLQLVNATSGALDLNFAQNVNTIIMANKGNKVISGSIVTVSGSTNLATTADDIDMTSGSAIINGTERSVGAQSISLDDIWTLLTPNQNVYVIIYLTDAATPILTAVGGTAGTGTIYPPEVPEDVTSIALIYLQETDSTLDSGSIKDYRQFTPSFIYAAGGKIAGAFNVTGGTTLAALSTSGVATLNSAVVTTTLSTGGIATLNSAVVTTTLSSGGLATLESAAITNDASVGGNLGVSGTVDGVDISVHAASASSHHAKYTSSDLESDLGITTALLLDGLNYGAPNISYMPCTPEPSPGATPYVVPGTFGYYVMFSTTTTEAVGINYTVPLPTTKGDLKLYVGDVIIGINGANGTNYISSVQLGGIAYTGGTQLLFDATPLNSPGKYTASNTLEDVSTYDQIKIQLTTSVATANTLKIMYVLVEYYYA